MVVQLDARILPVAVVLDGRIGLTLWAPPWQGPDGEVWEAFLSAVGDARVALFPAAAELHEFLHTGRAEAFSGHPAWPSIMRRDPGQLRAARDDLVDLDEVYGLAGQEPYPAAVAALCRAVALVSGIADTCDDRQLAAHLEASAYVEALDPVVRQSGRIDRKAWDALAGEVAASWEWVLARVGADLDWQGDFGQVDAEGLFAPAPGYPAAPYSAGPGPYPEVPAPYSSLAVAAFVLAFLTSFGLPSIVCGHLALGEIRRTGRRGQGLAVAALVLGYLELAVIVIGLVAILTATGS